MSKMDGVSQTEHRRTLHKHARSRTGSYWSPRELPRSIGKGKEGQGMPPIGNHLKARGVNLAPSN